MSRIIQMLLRYASRFNPSLRRGFVHLATGLLIGILALFIPRVIFLSLLGAATFVFLLTELLRFIYPTLNKQFCSFFRLVLRESELSQLTGASYFLVAALISFVIFERDVAVVAICFLAVGDSMAGIIGTLAGRTKLFKKTLEGTVACLIACLIVGFIFYFAGLNISVLAIVTGAAIATFAEALPLPIDDNLTIPILSGLAMTLLLWI